MFFPAFVSHFKGCSRRNNQSQNCLAQKWVLNLELHYSHWHSNFGITKHLSINSRIQHFLVIQHVVIYIAYFWLNICDTWSFHLRFEMWDIKSKKPFIIINATTVQSLLATLSRLNNQSQSCPFLMAQKWILNLELH